MSGRAFSVDRALANWEKRYPDKEERIEALKKELATTHEHTAVAWRGRPMTVSYPMTRRHIEQMLERLMEAIEQ
jgi:predicted RNase H-like nuclease (RuvC/YqgF family)